MLEELKEEEIVNKVGGRFKLSTLIQKRLVQLNAGSRALVDLDTGDKMADRAAGDHAGQDLPGHVQRSEDHRRTARRRQRSRIQPDGHLTRRHDRPRSLIGITGGIAAYKTAALVSQLVQGGARVSVAMTDAAAQFVGAATFAALTGRPVATQGLRPRPVPARARTSSWPSGPSCSASRRPRPTSWPRRLTGMPMTCSSTLVPLLSPGRC